MLEKKHYARLILVLFDALFHSFNLHRECQSKCSQKNTSILIQEGEFAALFWRRFPCRRRHSDLKVLNNATAEPGLEREYFSLVKSN